MSSSDQLPVSHKASFNSEARPLQPACQGEILNRGMFPGASPPLCESVCEWVTVTSAVWLSEEPAGFKSMSRCVCARVCVSIYILNSDETKDYLMLRLVPAVTHVYVKLFRLFCAAVLVHRGVVSTLQLRISRVQHVLVSSCLVSSVLLCQSAR